MAVDRNLLCACAELSQERAAAILAASPGEPFDAFLTATGAGGTCTACMLDLEHFFVEIPRVAKPDTAVAGAPERKSDSLKAKLYALLGRLPPKLAYNRSNWMPVLYGVGIRSYVWMANHPLLFVDRNEISDFDIRYTIRNGAGEVVHRGSESLPKNGDIRCDLTSVFGDPADLSIGSVKLDRLACRPAVRGTTRPQIEIVTPVSASTLHFAAPNSAYDTTFALKYQPDEDRNLITVQNCANGPFRLDLQYFADGGVGELHSVRLDLVAYESRLCAIDLPSDARRALGDRLLIIRIRGAGLGRLHLLNSRNDYSRISLDHL